MRPEHRDARITVVPEMLLINSFDLAEEKATDEKEKSEGVHTISCEDFWLYKHSLLVN
jgi:hypothetical protein